MIHGGDPTAQGAARIGDCGRFNMKSTLSALYKARMRRDVRWRTLAQTPPAHSFHHACSDYPLLLAQQFGRVTEGQDW